MTCPRVKLDGWHPGLEPVEPERQLPVSRVVAPAPEVMPAAAYRLAVAARRLGWEVQVRAALGRDLKVRTVVESVAVRLRREGFEGVGCVWGRTEGSTAVMAHRASYIGYRKVSSKEAKDYIYGGK